MTTSGQSPVAPPEPEAHARPATRLWVAGVGVFAAATAIRAWLAAHPEFGHQEDLVLFTRWIRGLVTHGLGGFSEAEYFCDYPPLMLLLFRGLGEATDFVVGGIATAGGLATGVKLMASLADLVTGAVLWVEGRRLLGAAGGLAAAALYLLNPAVIFDSAYWGQLDSVYTALLVIMLIGVGRRGWWIAGLAAGAAIAAKFQAIAIAPIALLEAYRLAGFAGLARVGLGAALACAAILTPFSIHGVAGETLQRSYVRVVGQYHDMSRNAYNLWYVLGMAETADTLPPASIARIAAQGDVELDAKVGVWRHFTLRRISLAVYALVVAVVLSLYSLRPGGVRLWGAAGLLALTFFLIPSEMHERYAFPALALLAIWAMADRVQERAYWLLSGLLLLNLAAVVSPAAMAQQVAAALLALFAYLIWMLMRPRGKVAACADPIVQEPQPVASRPLLRIFRTATWCAAVVFVIGGVTVWGWAAMTPAPDRPGVIWLDSLTPEFAAHRWRPARPRASVAGGLMRNGSRVYLRGVGVHAPARLAHRIPPEAERFCATVGINAATRDLGSARVRVRLDGVVAHETPVVLGNGDTYEIDLPVSGASILSLDVIEVEDDRGDHVDLALARFECRPK